MPIHDWTRVNSGTFHNFHVLWISTITNALNEGRLPDGLFAMAEQIVGQPSPDVVTLSTNPGWSPPDPGNGVTATRSRPKTRLVLTSEQDRYAAKAHRIVIRHELGQVVAVIEIVSPGNKSSQSALRSFVGKMVQFIDQGIHVLIVDLFPPGPRDPQGLHPLIWRHYSDASFELPPDKLLNCLSYEAGESRTAFIEPLAFGDALPEMPLFLAPEYYINVPLDQTYQSTWEKLPDALKRLI